MIIGILTSNNNDPFVHKLAEWVLYFGQEPIIIYENDLLNNHSLEIDVNTDKIGVRIKTRDGMTINFDAIDLFYRRSWHHSITYPENEEDFYKKQEMFTIRNLVLDKINQSGKLIGKCKTSSLYKMNHLQVAEQVGLKIPETKIVTSTDGLSPSKKYITKAINAVYLKQINSVYYTDYTARLDKTVKDINFYPSLVQSEIEKELELRAFVFRENFYCVAYISHKKHSEIDNRVLIAEGGVESYPYLLPNQIKEKIIKMMEVLDVELGSIELAVTKSGEYYFLDFNPFGQIAMTSFDAFPHIEKEIAKTLIRNDRK